MKQIHEWSFVLVSTSPLRIGTDDGDLLLDDNGRPFLPGTSWAGACRAYMTSLDESHQALFGSQGTGGVQQGSRLIFSDGICVTPQPFEARPRVQLDRATKTVHRAKFEQLTVAAGARFKVKLTLRTDDDSDKGRVEKMLDALNRGFIRLGAFKSTGGGKVHIRDGQYVSYDFSNREDLEAYVEQSKACAPWRPTPVVRFDVLNIVVSGELASPLLIAGQYPHDSSKPDRSPIQAGYDGQLRYIIPASSFKGALRHQVGHVIRALSADPALEEHIFGGRIILEDIILEEPKTKIYHRVAIHPIKGGYKDGALVEEETVSGRFATSLHVQFNEHSDRDKASVALILFALRDFAAGRQTLGSGHGIGRGKLSLSEIKMNYGSKSVTINFADRSLADPEHWLTELQAALDRFVKEGAVG